MYLFIFIFIVNLFICYLLIFFFYFESKEAYPIVRQLEKITVKKAQAKVVNGEKKNCWVPRTPPPRHLGVNAAS